MKNMLLGNNMHVMTQSLKGGDGPHLPHGLSVMNMYTEVISRSKWVAVVVKNLMAVPVTIAKDIKVTQVVVANAVPPVELALRTLKELDKVQGIQETKMSVERRKEVFLQQLDLPGLDGWSKANQVAVHALLTEYHGIFSLEPGELGCTNLAKHEIRVVDDEPFKEWFQRIPPSMVDEVWAHMKEMLEAGAVCPSPSPWCNAVILVCKKDGDLQFCIDFCKVNPRTKKDSYPFPWIQETIESLVRVGYFSCLDLKVGFWQILMYDSLKPQSRGFLCWAYRKLVPSSGTSPGQFIWWLHLCPSTWHSLWRLCPYQSLPHPHLISLSQMRPDLWYSSSLLPQYHHQDQLWPWFDWKGGW